MSIGHPPRNKQDRLGVLLRTADNSSGKVDPSSSNGDVLSLLEENARLRALAVNLSNLLGDLPVREWEDAGAACPAKPPIR
jgi:hypothetical protein